MLREKKKEAPKCADPRALNKIQQFELIAPKCLGSRVRMNESKAILFLIRRMMVPIDGSRKAVTALQTAVALASDYHADLTVVHVLPGHYTLVSASSFSIGGSSANMQTVYENEEKNWKRDY